MKIIDTFIYGQDNLPANTDVYEIIIDSSYLYVVYGGFLYLPILLTLNLATLMVKKSNANN